MLEKQITPMKKLSFNLRLLRQQLSTNFDVLELTETQSHSYRYEYTKGVKSDYILIFISKSNKDINFAFIFNYKGELESDYTIDVTIKDKDGDIKTINKFSYIKFKEVLNNMVSLGIKDESIINFILLLENVRDEQITKISENKKQIYEEIENKLKTGKQTLIELDNSMYKEYLQFSNKIKKSEEYLDYLELTNKLEEAKSKLNKYIRKEIDKTNLHESSKLLLASIKNHNETLKTRTVKPSVLYDLDRKYALRYGWNKLKVNPDVIISKSLSVKDFI